MKTKILLLITLAIIIGCHHNKEITTIPPKNENTKTKVENPCLDKANQDSKGVFRGFAIGESSDQNQSISESTDFAMADMSKKVISFEPRVVDGYTQNTKIQNAVEFEKIVKTNISNTSKVWLANVKVICQETYITDKKIYQTYATVEMKEEDMFNYFSKEIENASKMLKLQYDAAAFEKVVKERKAEYDYEYNKKIQK